jgi:hypothetical protein
MSEFLVFIINTIDAFYALTGSLLGWLTSEITISGITVLGYTFASLTLVPLDILFNWVTLGGILVLILIKKLIPGLG